MSKEVAIVALGIWLAILPFLGFPGSWRTPLIFLSGLSIAALGFFLRAEALSRGRGDRKDAPFSQNSASSASTHEEVRKVS